MTTIDDVSTNNMNFKHLDTTKDIVITPKNEFGNSVQLNDSHTWTAKVSDDTNYVGDYPVTLEPADPTSIVVNSADFTNLPAGHYHLEVWEEWIDSNNKKQRSIYPSPQKTIDFTIYHNVSDLAEKEIKTIGFQDVVDQAVMNIGMNYVFKVNTIEPDQTATVVQTAADGKNYVTFNIPRGAQGIQGNVGPAPTLKIGTVTKLNSDQTPTANISGDNGAYTLDLGIPQGVQGETNATATQALNVANSVDSKVTAIQRNGGGRNLVANTGTDIVIDATSDVTNNWSFAKLGFIEQPKQGDLITVSAEGTLTGTGTLDEYQVILYNANTTNQRSQSRILKVGKRDSVTLTLDNLDGNGDTVLLIYAGKNGETGGKKNVVHHLMVEKGTVAHDWSPAPEDAPSNDPQLVHKTGNETIAGDKTLVGNTTLATTTILAGNYGLRVTTSGIQKTTDGKTWVPANI